MKVSSLFDLVTDGRDLLTFFEGVDTGEQLVSRLERLKRQDPDEMLECIEGLRSSITKALSDTLEMSAVLDGDEEEEEEDPELEAALEKIAKESESSTGEETQNPPEPVAAEIPKDEVQSSS